MLKLSTSNLETMPQDQVLNVNEKIIFHHFIIIIITIINRIITATTI